MVRCGCQLCGQLQAELFIARLIGHKRFHHGFAGRERARLIEQQRPGAGQLLDRRPMAKQHVAACGPTERHPNRHRRGQAQRTRAGD